MRPQGLVRLGAGALSLEIRPARPQGASAHGLHPGGSGRQGGTVELAPVSSQFLEIPARAGMAGTLKITRKNS